MPTIERLAQSQRDAMEEHGSTLDRAILKKLEAIDDLLDQDVAKALGEPFGDSPTGQTLPSGVHAATDRVILDQVKDHRGKAVPVIVYIRKSFVWNVRSNQAIVNGKLYPRVGRGGP